MPCPRRHTCNVRTVLARVVENRVPAAPCQLALVVKLRQCALCANRIYMISYLCSIYMRGTCSQTANRNVQRERERENVLTGQPYVSHLPLTLPVRLGNDSVEIMLHTEFMYLYTCACCVRTCERIECTAECLSVSAKERKRNVCTNPNPHT